MPRRAFNDLPIVLGGIEASLRRCTHYDFWTSALRRPVLCDAKADLLLYGQNVVPQRLLDAGFHFRHPDLAPALRHLFKESKSRISVAEI